MNVLIICLTEKAKDSVLQHVKESKRPLNKIKLKRVGCKQKYFETPKPSLLFDFSRMIKKSRFKNNKEKMRLEVEGFILYIKNEFDKEGLVENFDYLLEFRDGENK